MICHLNREHNHFHIINLEVRGGPYENARISIDAQKDSVRQLCKSLMDVTERMLGSGDRDSL